MKILALADTESAYLWDYFEKSKLEGIDLILSCGDLSPDYLSFLATFFHGPVLYVHGNHDGCYKDTPPEGCVCIDDRIYVHEGIRILGLGGSMRYKDGLHQYTQHDMNMRILRLLLPIRMNGGIDILLTHSPAYKINDGEDLPHIGFKGFRYLLEKFSPRYFIHGHMHMNYRRGVKRICAYRDTVVVNAYERYVIDIK